MGGIKMDRRDRLEDIVECDLYGIIERLLSDSNNIKGINASIILSDIEWLQSQVNDLATLEDAFKNDQNDTIDYLRVSSVVFDGKLSPAKKTRQ